MVRVIAGEKGGRRLLAPPGRGTRPTSDRVREAAFSMLESMGEVYGARVWDLFAGSGAMGIEALSRGASHATFVEEARSAVSALRANLAAVGYGRDEATVVVGDVLSWVSTQVSGPSLRGGANGEVTVGLVTADPPYAWRGWDALLGLLAPLGALLLAETADDLALPSGWQALRSRRYGGTVVTVARPGRASPV